MARRPDRKPSPPRSSIRGITEQDFLSWRNHPVTLMVRAYFRDFSDEKVEEATASMLALSLTREDMVGVAAAVSIYEDLSDIQFADVVRFYEQKAMNDATRDQLRKKTTPADLIDLPPVVDEEEEDDAQDSEEGA